MSAVGGTEGLSRVGEGGVLEFECAEGEVGVQAWSLLAISTMDPSVFLSVDCSGVHSTSVSRGKCVH